MSLPTLQETRSRQTAMEAERHWWTQRLEAIRRRVQHRANSLNNVDIIRELQATADQLQELIAERTR